MDCSDARVVLAAYFDGELERGEARELEAHVDGCAACRGALSRLGELREAVRGAAPRERAPAALRARIAALAQATAAPAAGRVGARGWRAAAALVLAFGAGGAVVDLWNWGHSSGGEDALLAHDLFAGHWRALAAASPVDVVSSDRHTVKPWFAGKVAQSPLVADFADAGFPLVGGRVDYLGHERVPVLVYRHGQHLIDVFVLPGAMAAAIAQPQRQQGYWIAQVMLGGQTAAIVSDTDAGELKRFADLLAAAR